MALSREHLDDREALQPMASMSVVIAGWSVGVWTMRSWQEGIGLPKACSLSACGRCRLARQCVDDVELVPGDQWYALCLSHCRLDRRCVDDVELAGGYRVTEGMLSVCLSHCRLARRCVDDGELAKGMFSVCGHCRLDRQSVDDVELAGGYRVMKGMLSVCLWSLQAGPSVCGRCGADQRHALCLWSLQAGPSVCGRCGADQRHALCLWSLQAGPSVCGRCGAGRRVSVTNGMLSVCGHYRHGGLVAKASTS